MYHLLLTNYNKIVALNTLSMYPQKINIGIHTLIIKHTRLTHLHIKQ